MDECTIHITVDESFCEKAEATYEPGHPVIGRVNLSLQAQKKVEGITILLEGLCFTEITKNRTNSTQPIIKISETLCLLSFKQELFQGPLEVQPGTASWRYSFQLPERLESRLDQRERSSTFNSGPQSLPPSLDTHLRSIKARITYQLTATVNFSDIEGPKTCVFPITVLPFLDKTLPPPASKPVRIGWQQNYKGNRLRARQHNLQQKISHILTEDPALKTPSMTFRTTAYLPKSASIWHYLPLAISIQYQKTGPTDPPNPTLILENVTLHLKQYTFACVEGHQTNGSDLIVSKVIEVNKQLALDNTPLDVSISSYTKPANNSGIKSFRLADFIPKGDEPLPSFTTYTINHSYVLKLDVSILHKESGHRFVIKEVTLLDLKILPMRYPNLDITLTRLFKGYRFQQPLACQSMDGAVAACMQGEASES